MERAVQPASPVDSRFGLAGPGDEPELRRLLRDNPLGGAVQVSLEREPNFFDAAAAEGSRHHVAVERAPDGTSLLAMGCRSARPRYVDGRARWVPYLGALRVDPSVRGGVFRFRRGFRLLWNQGRPDETPWALTSIVADSPGAWRLLTAGVPGLPRYTPVAEIVTLVIPTRRLSRIPTRATSVARGSGTPTAEILDCLKRNHESRQFAPVWSKEDLTSSQPTRGPSSSDFLLLRQGPRVAGCAAVWDQRSFKQVVVRGYHPRLARLRPLVNLLAPWLGTPRLPAVGRPLEQAFLSHLAVDGSAEAGVTDLVAAALTRARDRGCDSVVLGLDVRDPLLPAIAAAFSHRIYRSILCVVAWAREPVDLPDATGRILYPEVAVL